MAEQQSENTMELRIREEDIEPAQSFVEDLLDRKGISREVTNEILLIFEALFQKLLDSGLGEDAELYISWAKKIGGVSVRVEFEGEPFDLYDGPGDSVEDKILRGCGDKLACSYRAGYNVINIQVSSNYRKRVFACGIAALLAIVAYVPMHYLLDGSVRNMLLESYIYPLESAYGNAALMVGAPMTFFSLLKNLTDTYVVSHRRAGMGKLQVSTIITSAIAIVLAVIVGFLLSVPLAGFAGAESDYASSGFDRSFAEIITSSVPPSIFEPFESISPIPLLLVAVLVAYALCSAGRHFNALREAMEACYTLFSRMLHVVTAMLPAFCFFAFLDVLITDDNAEGILLVLGYFAVIYAGLLLILASYAIRLRARGIPVIPFVRKLIPLVRENLKIGSVIDAAPFNIRYCARAYGMNRAKLERALPALAQVNLDGNCFIIMLASLIFLFMTGTEFAWFNIIGLGLLVLLLSMGAPNQPGSILIGVLIVTMYLHSYDAICSAIYLEAFLGSAQNIINVIGDIVIVAIEDRTSAESEA